MSGGQGALASTGIGVAGFVVALDVVAETLKAAIDFKPTGDGFNALGAGKSGQDFGIDLAANILAFTNRKLLGGLVDDIPFSKLFDNVASKAGEAAKLSDITKDAMSGFSFGSIFGALADAFKDLWKPETPNPAQNYSPIPPEFDLNIPGFHDGMRPFIIDENGNKQYLHQDFQGAGN